ncbi:hypothetical protein [Silvibacterium acidisoli]|uniref:hypothetical protein n=1 Tax=Acidobacteriaceae bacterium ZG23-2 TaxID=2883246 RepID=UPI00406D0701
MDLKNARPVLELPQKVARISPRLSIAGGDNRHFDDPRWQLAQRIAASESIGRSKLLADFLLYIVDRHIRDLTDEITEQQIGVLVFGRAEGYDSNEDNIVRSYARNLRKRIDEYFATEGREETLLLQIPRGGYTPIFSSAVKDSSTVGFEECAVSSQETASGKVEIVDSPLLAPVEPSSSGTISSHASIGPRRIRFTMLLCLLAGILLGMAAMFFSRVGPVISQRETASHALWAQMFGDDRDTFVVPSDVGLVIMQRLIQRPLPLGTYVNGSYLTKASTESAPNSAEVLKLGSRRFTNVVDLEFVTHLAQLKEVVPERMKVRYARDLRMEDLRTSNAIFIGSDESNPWVELFRPQLHFTFRFDSDPDKPSGFVNLYPRAGEPAIYSTAGHQERTFGIIAYLPNLNNNGHVLIVAGLNTAGTEAAASFLLNPSLMAPTLQRAKTAHGGLQSFELLVRADDFATNASAPSLVLERIGLPQAR